MFVVVVEFMNDLTTVYLLRLFLIDIYLHCPFFLLTTVLLETFLCVFPKSQEFLCVTESKIAGFRLCTSLALQNALPVLLPRVMCTSRLPIVLDPWQLVVLFFQTDG